MRIPKIAIPALGAIAFVVTSSILALPSVMADEASVVSEGKSIAFDRKKGNCLACHAIVGGQLPGNIGPPLKDIKQAYPNEADLRAQIFDATVRNPNTIMPPFGKHKILTSSELDKVVEFIYSL